MTNISIQVMHELDGLFMVQHRLKRIKKIICSKIPKEYEISITETPFDGDSYVVLELPEKYIKKIYRALRWRYQFVSLIKEEIGYILIVDADYKAYF